MPKARQSGFTVVETLLVLIFVAIIGFTGYYVWHSQQQTAKTLSATNAASQLAAKSTTLTTSNNATAYMDIKEWSVKLPLTASIADANYAMPSGSDFVTLSVDSLKTTSCAADQTSLGGIERFKGTDMDTETNKTILSENPSALKIGDYYYNFQHTQASCGDDQTTQNKAQAIQSTFQQQVKYLKAN